MWYTGAARVYRADAGLALRQINAAIEAAPPDPQAIEARRRHYTASHEARRRDLEAREQMQPGVITPEYLTACVRRFCDTETIVLNEGITNYSAIVDHICACRPSTLFTSGGGSLGWNGGAAIGMKLACPNKTIVSLTGDGSYLFSQPSSVHWIARRYRTPFVQVVYNNGGWRAPKFSAMAVHPHGHASQGDDVGVSFDPPPDYAGIAAAAGGAFGQTIRDPEQLPAALEAAFRAVRQEQRCAVLDVLLPHL